MAVIAEDRRMAELQRLGASAQLMRLAAGECIHDVFRHTCLGPPFYVYHGARVPDGFPLVPLWDHGGRVAGVWERPDGLEFIDFDIEAPDGFEATARTEQGFWATRFDVLYELDASIDDLQRAATLVGFRFLDRHLASREAAEERLNTFGEHRSWLRELVAGIDREAIEA